MIYVYEILIINDHKLKFYFIRLTVEVNWDSESASEEEN